MRIVIADDHRVVRDGLRLMLEDQPGIEIVAEVADGAELLDLLATDAVDVALLDISMPVVSGLEALERLADMDSDVRVIILSMHDKPVYVRRAIELGAAGYLLKSAGRDELLRALEIVGSGGNYIQGEATGALIRQIAGTHEEPRLPKREREVLLMVAAGKENKQIARELGISEATVKAHLKSVFARLGVTSRAEAVAVALRRGLID